MQSASTGECRDFIRCHNKHAVNGALRVNIELLQRRVHCDVWDLCCKNFGNVSLPIVPLHQLCNYESFLSYSKR